LLISATIEAMSCVSVRLTEEILGFAQGDFAIPVFMHATDRAEPPSTGA
jgi:hypothetical protein